MKFFIDTANVKEIREAVERADAVIQQKRSEERSADRKGHHHRRVRSAAAVRQADRELVPVCPDPAVSDLDIHRHLLTRKSSSGDIRKARSD